MLNSGRVGCFCIAAAASSFVPPLGPPLERPGAPLGDLGAAVVCPGIPRRRWNSPQDITFLLPFRRVLPQGRPEGQGAGSNPRLLRAAWRLDPPGALGLFKELFSILFNIC